MVNYGLIVSVIGFFMYIVGTIFYNYYLRKNNLDLLENHSKIHDKTQSRWSQNKKSNTRIQVVMTSTSLPKLVGMTLFLSIPLIIVGIVIIILSLVIDIFR
ncbi:hypothetical protein BN874_2420004 [Candidatus Contendobacter odensis Run_B_J11]|jgi:uncharacterized membrane protein|uniref:Uncharacterized protein n=1 Tax=Candidatus Contendobacter odensis Run_B_J11 TaxID=1400861 RepID=A0A7U7GBN2_9GAMM|nr:hypothetical protein BN874_2420004 [Candidatus Contendobacter odensis Run_B_J11]